MAINVSVGHVDRFVLEDVFVRDEEEVTIVYAISSQDQTSCRLTLSTEGPESLIELLELALDDLRAKLIAAGTTDEEARGEDELAWPWPLTNPTATAGGRGNLVFEHEASALKLCGYTVGKTKGLPARDRRRFLDCFFRNRLPSWVSEMFADEYGAPGSEVRLRKIANLIAGNCRVFKLNDPHKYASAITDWEDDLAYLRSRYYRPGSFPWPQTDG